MKPALKGTVRGKTIELDGEPGFPDGQSVNVMLEPSTPAESPRTAAALEALQRAAGSWSDDIEGLDRYLEWNRQRRSAGSRDSRMSFLHDKDICSAYLKNDSRVVAKVMLHFGGLHVSVVTAAELLTWARRAAASPARFDGVRDLLAASVVHDVNLAVAEEFGSLRGPLHDRGRVVGELDLLNASVALVHNLAMVTHNVQDYANVPGLTLIDWMAP